MKLGLFGLATAAAITISGGTVSAQQVVYPAPAPVVYPAPAPVAYPAYPAPVAGLTIGGAIRGPGGVVIGGTYSTAPAVPVAPVAPVVQVAPAPVVGVSVGVPLVRYGYYPYYGRPYPYYYHRR
jgi:hypothetical protein